MHMKSLSARSVVTIEKNDVSATDLIFSQSFLNKRDPHLSFEQDRSPAFQNCPSPAHPMECHCSLPGATRLMPGSVFSAPLLDRRDANRVKEMHLTVRQCQFFDAMSNGG